MGFETFWGNFGSGVGFAAFTGLSKSLSFSGIVGFLLVSSSGSEGGSKFGVFGNPFGIPVTLE